jgi:hypothetical protein
MTHLITLEDICGQYTSTIAASANAKTRSNKVLLSRTYISPSNVRHHFKVTHGEDNIAYSGDNIDEAIQAYNNLP